eukprot:403360552
MNIVSQIEVVDIQDSIDENTNIANYFRNLNKFQAFDEKQNANYVQNAMELASDSDINSKKQNLLNINHHQHQNPFSKQFFNQDQPHQKDHKLIYLKQFNHQDTPQDNNNMILGSIIIHQNIPQNTQASVSKEFNNYSLLSRAENQAQLFRTPQNKIERKNYNNHQGQQIQEAQQQQQHQVYQNQDIIGGNQQYEDEDLVKMNMINSQKYKEKYQLKPQLQNNHLQNLFYADSFYSRDQKQSQLGPNNRDNNDVASSSDQMRSYDGRILRITKDGKRQFVYSDGRAADADFYGSQIEQTGQWGQNDQYQGDNCYIYEEDNYGMSSQDKSENIVIKERTEVVTNMCGCIQVREYEGSDIAASPWRQNENNDPNVQLQKKQHRQQKTKISDVKQVSSYCLIF